MSVRFKFISLALGLGFCFLAYLLITYDQGWISQNILVSLVIVFLIAFLSCFVAYSHLIVVPLNRITRSMSRSELEPIQGMLTRSDEFGQLARLIQRVFQQQVEVDEEIRRREETETALRASQEAYRAVVDYSFQGLAILQDGQVLFSNRTLANEMGYTTDELMGLPDQQVLDMVHPEDRAMTIEYLRSCMESGEVKQFEIRMFRKDRTLCWMQVFVNRVEYQGKPAIQFVNLDITDRKKAEQALHQEQAFALAIFNTVSSPVVVLDRDGKLVRCNPAAERVAGLSMEEMCKLYFWELLNFGGDIPAVKNQFRVLVEDRVSIQRESYFQLYNGRHFWFSWLNSFLFDVEGEVQYVVGAGVNITERVQQERQQHAIAEISSTLKGFLSKEQTYRLILEEVTRFLHVDLAAIALVHPESMRMVVEAAVGLYSADLLHTALPIENEGVSGHVIHTKRPVLSQQLSQDALLLRPDMVATLKSGAWIPLEAEGETLGMLLVASRGEISESEFQWLTAIANVAAGAIHRSLLTDETQQRLRRLTALHTINIAVSASLDIRVTLSVLVNQITSQLGVDAADILLIDPLDRNLFFAAGHGFRSRGQEQVRLWLGEGRAGQVAMERKSLHLYNPMGIATEFAPARQFDMDDFIAYDAVPLMIKGEIKGVLETFQRAPYEPDPEWLQFLEALATETSIAINNVELLERLQRNNHDLALAYDATIEGWALALEMRDRTAEGHTRRVADWTVHLAQSLKISSEDLVHMRRGALLHDIGKMGIPDSILNKTGPLSDEEWVIMRMHPQYGFEMLSSIPFLRQAIAIPYSHHERWDGSGYPQGLAGKQIPLAARIFAVVDVWDALFSGRQDHDLMTEEQVLVYLQKESGRLFDPDVVDAFVQLRRIVSIADRTQPGRAV